MNQDIELAIDLAALVAVCEMYPSAIPTQKVANLVMALQKSVEEQPSAEMLLNYLFNKYQIV